MTKLFGHSVRSQMLVLYLVETVVCFLTVYALLRFGMDRAMPAITSPKGVAFVAVLALSTGMIASAAGLYQPEAWRRLGRFLLRSAVAAALLFLVAQVVLYLLDPTLEGTARWNALAVLLAGLVSAMMVTHLAFAAAMQRGLWRHRLAVLRGPEGLMPFERRGDDGFEVAVAGTVDAAGEPGFSAEALRARRIWAVIVPDIALVPPARRADWEAGGVRLYSAADFAEQRTNRIDLAQLAPGWLPERAAGSGRGLEEAVRRGIDIAGSLALLVLTLPLSLVTALAIRLDSPGPVFYRQERVGRDGRVFTLYKFRSMRADAEAAGAPRWATKGDDRVTRVGRFIRLTRIDEIPQALNVLVGHMSLVGPRPERPAFVAQLAEAIPYYGDRARVRPGITGWAQVNYPYGASVEDARMKLAYDLYYVKHRSLFLDLLILIATVRVVLFQEGSR
jgi:exopolysaccharide biosynthesis polyprenyl glycosylphosphotransferase